MRMSIDEQIERGHLVCPVIKKTLVRALGAESLTIENGEAAYRLLPSGVLILHADYAVARGSLMRRAVAALRNNYRTAAPRQAFDRAFDSLPAASLAISPGGGPVRFLPSIASTTLVAAAFRNLLPRPLSRIAWSGWIMVALLFRPMDRLLERHPAAHNLASTTYLVIEKPTAVGS
jgi:hypothetical protein